MDKIKLKKILEDNFTKVIVRGVDQYIIYTEETVPLYVNENTLIGMVLSEKYNEGEQFSVLKKTSSNYPSQSFGIKGPGMPDRERSEEAFREILKLM